jgi:hypothetical protein
MRETRCASGVWALCFGLWLVAILFAAVVWSVYKSYDTVALLALCAGGFLFWLIRFILIRRNEAAKMRQKYESAGSSREVCLEGFYLNGRFFQPYEEAISIGHKKFRLLSRPPMAPEHEAALIRYLINEGLSEQMWPQISRRIEEEATWAFFA